MSLRLLALAALFTATRSCLAATYHVAQQAPGANDANPGTEARPLATISAAMLKVQPGDTVLVHAGTYRESVVFPGEDWKDPQRRCTLAGAEGERPVIKGSDVLPTDWTRLEGERPIYYQPRNTYTQMVFVDEQPLRQIGLQGSPKRAAGTNGFQYQRQWSGKGLDDMAPGSFFYDEAQQRLYVWLADGGDPAQHTIEAAVRSDGVLLKGTWTLRNLDVRHVADDFWPHEQAVAIGGNQSVVENCRITHNEFLGLIISGEDCVVRGNEIAYNGLEGLTSNLGYRMLVEGNEIHHNAWRGDVVCLTAGNKLVMWRDSKFLRNHWHDEPASALWLDISDGNILIAENRFDNCSVGVYFEISRWAVIANNVFRGCGRAIWSYGSDVLIAHNVVDRCGEGITISGYVRDCDYTQAISEPLKYCLMAVRNNLVVNNLLVDCAGSFIGISEDDGFGAGNFSDHNAFVWTMPASHLTGLHINFMSGWNALYGRLPEWRLNRHYDEHSVVVDRVLYDEVHGGSPFVALGRDDVVREVSFADRDNGDYRLPPGSPLEGRGVRVPEALASPCKPCDGSTVLSRQWATTLVADAPDPASAPTVTTTSAGHYRLQPLPRFQRLFDLDAQPPNTPGLNLTWQQTGQYPVFDANAPAETVEPDEWVVYPANRLKDSRFNQDMAKAGEAGGPWVTGGTINAWSGIACANLFPANQERTVAYQKVGRIAPDCEYILFGDLLALSAEPRFGAVAEMYLAVGDALQPLEPVARMEGRPGQKTHWQTVFTRYRAGAAGQDAHVGQDLCVVIGGHVSGPADAQATDPVAFLRWDNLTLLTGEAP
ncbi:MAG: hypothetical protein HPY69_15465 [Armatimonadetes bacterium]|nr:hypothetical protein [Armatimonadota bacterium]